MSMFKPGDPVWVKSLGPAMHDEIPAGEHAGVVEKYCDAFMRIFFIPGYEVELCEHRPSHICAAEHRLRPRRDDYQQHEPLGSRSKLTEPKAPDLTEQAVEELCEEYLTSPTKWYLP